MSIRYVLTALLSVVLLTGCTKSVVPEELDTPSADTTCLWPTRDTATLLYGCVNKQGEWVIPALYDEMDGFSCGLCPVMYQGLPAYLSVDGSLHYPEGIDLTDTVGMGYDSYYVFEPFYHHYAVVTKVCNTSAGEAISVSGLVDTNMQMVLPMQFAALGTVSANGLLAVQPEADGKWGYMDVMGAMRIVPQFDFAEAFYEDRAPVSLDYVWGLIDEKGDFVLEPQYDFIWPLTHDRWAVINDDAEEAMLDGHGKVIVPFGRYFGLYGATDATPLISCTSKETAQSGWLDIDGNEVIACMYSIADPFNHGYALGIDIETTDSFSLHIVDTRGVVVYSLWLTGAYEENTILHNGVVDVWRQENALDYSGTLLTLEGDTIHHWLCRQQ